MNKILIVVDMQKGFINKPNYVSLNQKINTLIKSNNYTNYIFTKFINLQNSLYETKLKWFGLKTPQEQEISVELPKNKSIIFEKFGYGLSLRQIEFIKNLNVDTVDICGLQTDACVYAIALQLFDNGIYPNILINYCETAPSRNKIVKKILKHQFGQVDDKE